MVPYEVDPVVVEVGAEEVAWSDREVAVAEQSGWPGRPQRPARLISGRCWSSQRCSSPSTGGSSGKKGMKWKRRRSAASTRAIDRSAVFIVPMISRFSGSENGSSEYCNAMVVVAVLKQEVQLPEHLRHVAPVDLIDHQIRRCRRVGVGGCGQPFERPLTQSEPGLAPLQLSWSVTLNEVLVGV